MVVEFTIELLKGTVTMSVPFILGSIGEIIGERSGILNLGIEGMMLMGAFAGFFTAWQFDNIWLGIVGGITVGMVLGLFMGFLCIHIRANQVVAGLMLGSVCMGLAVFFYKTMVASLPVIPKITTLKPISIPLLSSIPVVGEILFTQNFMVYFAIVICILAYILLFKTTFGLKIRAVGENPLAVDVLGINVYRVRYISVMLAGALIGAAGAYLSIGRVGLFIEGMSGGRGFMCLVIVIFSSWSPIRALIGSLLFSCTYALQFRLQALGTGIPSYFLLMIPYILTLAITVYAYKKAKAPSALTRPYKRMF